MALEYNRKVALDQSFDNQVQKIYSYLQEQEYVHHFSTCIIKEKWME